MYGRNRIRGTVNSPRPYNKSRYIGCGSRLGQIPVLSPASLDLRQRRRSYDCGVDSEPRLGVSNILEQQESPWQATADTIILNVLHKLYAAYYYRVRGRGILPTVTLWTYIALEAD
jgi:hypothetical protein